MFSLFFIILQIFGNYLVYNFVRLASFNVSRLVAAVSRRPPESLSGLGEHLLWTVEALPHHAPLGAASAGSRDKASHPDRVQFLIAENNGMSSTADFLLIAEI